MIQIIKPGHYCTKDTINMETKNIIRILGPDKNKEGYWVTSDGKSLHESYIVDDYIPLDTQMVNDEKTRRKPDIMRGFAPVEIFETENEIHVPEEIPKLYTKETTETVRNIPEKIPQPKIDKTTELIEKASIQSLNAHYKKRYGTEPYKPLEIEIPVKIIIKYEPTKLNQLIELFDIDIHKVSEIIYKNTEFPKSKIIEIIEDRINGKSDMLVGPAMTPAVAPESETKSETESESEPIKEGIREIDDYIIKMFGTPNGK